MLQRGTKKRKVLLVASLSPSDLELQQTERTFIETKLAINYLEDASTFSQKPHSHKHETSIHLHSPHFKDIISYLEEPRPGLLPHLLLLGADLAQPNRLALARRTGRRAGQPGQTAQARGRDERGGRAQPLGQDARRVRARVSARRAVGAVAAGFAAGGRGLNAALAAGHLAAVDAALLRAVVEAEDLAAEHALRLAVADATALHALEAVDEFPGKENTEVELLELRSLHARVSLGKKYDEVFSFRQMRGFWEWRILWGCGLVLRLQKHFGRA